MTSPQRQPLLHDLAVTLAAPTVVLSAPDGNLDAATPGAGVQGLFHADVRAVSRLRVTLRPVDSPSGVGAPSGADALSGAGAPSGEHAGKAPPTVGEGVVGEGTADGDGAGWLPVVAVMTATEDPAAAVSWAWPRRSATPFPTRPSGSTGGASSTPACSPNS